MNAIRNKIKSQEGASLTFALLIFLVCAIISGVVIVAGSTAAGRMSQIAQSDQRYYAVTSAAGLLRDDIDDTTVTVMYKEDASGVYVDGSAETTKVVAGTASDKDIKDQKEIIADATCFFVRNLAKDSTLSSTNPPVFTLTVQGGAAGGGGSAVTTDYSYLNCSVTERATTDGRLIFEITNPIPENGSTKPSYTLQIVFNANISESYTQGKDKDGNDIKNVSSTVKWTFAGIKKGKLPATT